MDIAWFRDLVICIFGLVVSLVAIFIAVLSYLLYTRVKSVLDSMKTASSIINEICSAVQDEIIGPIVQLVALIRGVFQGIDLVSRLFKKEAQEGGTDG